MPKTTTSMLRHALWLFLLTAGMAACSGSDPGQLASPAATPEPTAAGQIDSATAAPAAPTNAANDTEPSALDAQGLASIVDLQAGEQITDVLGNVIAVYGLRPWPTSFDQLPDEAQAIYPFGTALAALADPDAELLALDVGMCAAGIDAARTGTAEFSVQTSGIEELIEGTEQGHGLFAPVPVVSPAFTFPAAARCERGWVPVLWSVEADAGVARYLLTTRSSAGAAVQQHLYQWQVQSTNDAQASVDDTGDNEPFGTGQIVTFHDGVLAGTTVDVDGWTELIGNESAIANTRLVAVKINVCPSVERWPDFGISLDGWNLAAPISADQQLGRADGTCFDGWIEFAVPFGAVPTGFFASDGVDATFGYAEWSLDNAALAAPQ